VNDDGRRDRGERTAKRQRRPYGAEDPIFAKHYVVRNRPATGIG
jgi:hypothetical protein